jgi:hypothetical protein
MKELGVEIKQLKEDSEKWEKQHEELMVDVFHLLELVGKTAPDAGKDRRALDGRLGELSRMIVSRISDTISDIQTKLELLRIRGLLSFPKCEEWHAQYNL